MVDDQLRRVVDEEESDPIVDLVVRRQFSSRPFQLFDDEHHVAHGLRHGSRSPLPACPCPSGLRRIREESPRGSCRRASGEQGGASAAELGFTSCPPSFTKGSSPSCEPPPTVDAGGPRPRPLPDEEQLAQVRLARAGERSHSGSERSSAAK